MKDSIRKNLAADDKKITMKTLNSEQKMKSTVTSGLNVRSGSDEGKKRWIDLPATYSKEDPPVDAEEVATREKIEIWDELKKIANKVPKASDIEIGLLTEASCAKALEPQEVIPSKDGGAFACKSPLDWCVV